MLNSNLSMEIHILMSELQLQQSTAVNGEYRVTHSASQHPFHIWGIPTSTALVHHSQLTSTPLQLMWVLLSQVLILFQAVGAMRSVPLTYILISSQQVPFPSAPSVATRLSSYNAESTPA